MSNEKLHLIIVVFQDLHQRTIMQRDGVGESYERVSARLWMSPADMDRLGVLDRDFVEIQSDTGTVVVRARTLPECKDGVGYMPASLYAMRLTNYNPSTTQMADLQRFEGGVGRTDMPITPVLALIKGDS